MDYEPMITKEFLRKLRLYCYDDVQEFLDISKALDAELLKREAEQDHELVNESLMYLDLLFEPNTDAEIKQVKDAQKRAFNRIFPSENDKIPK